MGKAAKVRGRSQQPHHLGHRPFTRGSATALGGAEAVAMRRSLFLLALLPCICFAHTAKIASAKAVVKADGSFVLKVRFDVVAFVLDLTPNEVADGPMNALLDGPVAVLDSQLADARGRFVGNLKIADAHFEMADFPTAADVHQIVDSGVRPRLPVMMTAVFRGHL